MGQEVMQDLFAILRTKNVGCHGSCLIVNVFSVEPHSEHHRNQFLHERQGGNSSQHS